MDLYSVIVAATLLFGCYGPGKTQELKTANQKDLFDIWSSLFPTAQPSVPTAEPEPTVATPPCDCKCGIANRASKIVNGKQTQSNEYPWMAAITYNKKSHCGGSLITNSHILTAAHCVYEFSRKSFEVILGAHNRTSSSERTVKRKVSLIARHSKYTTASYDNDIAIMKLDKPVTFNSNIKPICLPSAGENFAGQDGTVLGWGKKSESLPTSPVLLEVTVPIMTNEECGKSNYGTKRITSNMLCAGFKKGQKDACQGDSGGPLLVGGKKKMSISGIVSWGNGCARPNYPGVYTRVTRYLSWIKNQTKGGCYCKN